MGFFKYKPLPKINNKFITELQFDIEEWIKEASRPELNTVLNTEFKFGLIGEGK